MKVYQNIDIGHAWSSIQLRYQKIFGQETVTKDTVLPEYENIWIAQQLAEPLAKLGYINKPILRNLVFIQEPNNQQKIHIDGRSLDRTHSPNYALNIPIIGTGTMIWYTGEYERYMHATDSGLKGIGIKWITDKIILDQAVVSSPCIVKVDIPHQVIASDAGMRVMLSIRYKPDLVID